jgi:hypothetical protein
MAGDTSVARTPRLIDAIPRHAQRRVAEREVEGSANAKAAPAKRPVGSGISGLDAAADEKVRAYLQADDELPGKLARIDGSALAPNEKTAEKRNAIISVARLHQEVGAVFDQKMDTPLVRAKYAESHVNELGQELDKARETGVFTDSNLTEKYDEAVRNNVARWRDALRNAVADPMLDPLGSLLRSCEVGLRRAKQLASRLLNPRQLDDATKLELGKNSRQIDEKKGSLAASKGNRELEKIWSGYIKYLEQERSDLVAGEIAPGLHQTPLELADAAKQELTAKARELDDAKAALAVKSDREARSTLSDYVKVLKKEYREVVISNFEAAHEANTYAAHLKPPDKAEQDKAAKNYHEALGLLRRVAPKREPTR